MSNKYNLSHDCEGENIVPKASTPSWFRPDVDPVKIRELMTKSDGRALMDTLIWLASMVFFCGTWCVALAVLVVNSILVSVRRALWICLRLKVA